MIESTLHLEADSSPDDLSSPYSASNRSNKAQYNQTETGMWNNNNTLPDIVMFLLIQHGIRGSIVIGENLKAMFLFQCFLLSRPLNQKIHTKFGKFHMYILNGFHLEWNPFQM